MKVHWLIENFVDEKSYTDLSKAVEAAGHDCIVFTARKGYSRNQIQRFQPEFPNRPSYPPLCVIVQGSIQFVKLLQEDLGPNCSPIAYYNFDAFFCSRYYSQFGDMLFNDKYMILSLAEIQRQKFFVYGALGKDGLIFLRPDSGDKPFQAQLVDIQDLDRFVENNVPNRHDMMLVSTPKNLSWEGRFICTKNEIIAHSTYRYQGQRTLIPAVPKETMEFCEKVLKVGYYPDEVFCVDICQDNDGQPFLLELTSFSSAGLYEANKAAIVKRVSEIALEKFK